MFDNRASMNARQSEGRTATVRTLEQVESFEEVDKFAQGDLI